MVSPYHAVRLFALPASGLASRATLTGFLSRLLLRILQSPSQRVFLGVAWNLDRPSLPKRAIDSPVTTDPHTLVDPLRFKVLICRENWKLAVRVLRRGTALARGDCRFPAYCTTPNGIHQVAGGPRHEGYWRCPAGRRSTHHRDAGEMQRPAVQRPHLAADPILDGQSPVTGGFLTVEVRHAATLERQ